MKISLDVHSVGVFCSISHQLLQPMKCTQMFYFPIPVWAAWPSFTQTWYMNALTCNATQVLQISREVSLCICSLCSSSFLGNEFHSKCIVQCSIMVINSDVQSQLGFVNSKVVLGISSFLSTKAPGANICNWHRYTMSKLCMSSSPN